MDPKPDPEFQAALANFQHRFSENFARLLAGRANYQDCELIFSYWYELGKNHALNSSLEQLKAVNERNQ